MTLEEKVAEYEYWDLQRRAEEARKSLWVRVSNGEEIEEEHNDRSTQGN